MSRNKIVVCRECNGDKNDLTLREWYAHLVAAGDNRAPHLAAFIRAQTGDDDGTVPDEGRPAAAAAEAFGRHPG